MNRAAAMSAGERHSVRSGRLAPGGVLGAQGWLDGFPAQASSPVGSRLLPVGDEVTGVEYSELLGDIVGLLEGARSAAARGVNTVMTTAYWLIGRRMVEREQGGERRADYGAGLIDRLSADLTTRLGRGFSSRNLRQMRQFYLTWSPDRIRQTASAESSIPQIRQTVSAESTTAMRAASLPAIGDPVWARALPLPWSAYVRLMTVKNDHARAFYETEALRNGWTTRQLDRQINAMFYERAALSKDKAEILQHSTEEVPADAVNARAAIRDPFVLEFLDLKDEYSETDLEEALIDKLADFLLELGDDFTFLAPPAPDADR